MATDAEWKKRIGARIAELRTLKGWSQDELGAKVGMSQSRLGNYEQGTRMIGPEEAVLLGDALGESPAHIFCLDDDMPALSKIESKLINDLRALPEEQRAAYAERIALLAAAYKTPVPTDRVLETGYNPKTRPRGKAKPAVKTKGGTQ